MCLASCHSCHHPNVVTGQEAEVFGVTSLNPFKVERGKREKGSDIKPPNLRACARRYLWFQTSVAVSSGQLAGVWIPGIASDATQSKGELLPLAPLR